MYLADFFAFVTKIGLFVMICAVVLQLCRRAYKRVKTTAQKQSTPVSKPSTWTPQDRDERSSP